MPSHNHSTNGQHSAINYNNGSTTKWGHSTSNGDWWFMTVTESVQYTGGNQKHNNLSPYISIYLYKRTG